MSELDQMQSVDQPHGLHLVIAVGGIPASGKTTLMWTILTELKLRKQNSLDFQFGLLRATYFPKINLTIFGIYKDGDLFAGTDKLSMAVQADTLGYIRQQNSRQANAVYLFEGDRLFTQSFFDTLLEIEHTRLEIVLLQTFKELQTERCRQRGSNQSEKFLKGRETKLARINDKYFERVQTLPSHKPHHIAANTRFILGLMDKHFYTNGLIKN